MTYTILISKVPIILKHVDKLNRKAKKHGLPCVSITKGNTITQQYNDNGTPKVKIYQEISIDIPEIKISNYSFVATINHIETGNVVKKSPLFEDFPLPEKYFTIDPHCQHCNINRYRVDTFLLRNDLTSEIKQIGRNCLKDYIGHDVQGFIAQIEYTQNLIHIIGGSGEDDDIYTKTKSSSTGYPMEFFTSYVAMITRLYGFASTQSENSTCDRVYYAIEEKGETPNDHDKDTALKAIEWAKTLDPTNDYLYNLKNSVLIGYVNGKTAGIIASLVNAYLKFISKFTLTSNSNSIYIGTIGEKITQTLTYKKLFSFESQYGTCYIHIFEDKESNVYTWKTNKTLSINIDDTVSLKGTIKAHQEYKGTKQTILTRCKINKV